MPLINGKEVFKDELQASKIQQQINSQKIIDEIKSGVDPSKILKDITDNNLNQTEILFNDNGLDDLDGNNRTRKERYDTYRRMDKMEFIHRGIEIISDDSTQSNDDGNVLDIIDEDEDIKNILNELFLTKLSFNDELWSIVYETVKMGDNFYEIIPDNIKKPKEIKRIKYINPDKIERIEKNNKLLYFKYKTKKKDETTGKDIEVETKLFPWQVVHFKIENKENIPYGGSLLEAGVRTFERLSMLADLMLVYRISRAPERRVFYVDVGNLNAVEAKRFLMKMKNAYRSQSFIDDAGNINKKANVMSITSDIFVPVREGQQGTRIETLQGGTSMGSGSEDPLLTYFKNKILMTMNIPASYMTQQADSSKTLSSIDQKFARFIERIQAQIIKGLNKIAIIELIFKGYKKEDLTNFKIQLTPPSNVKEITEVELINQRMALVATIQQTNLFSNEWILKKIFKMSDKEIADITLQKKLEAQNAQNANAPEGGMGLGGGMDLGMGGEMPPAEGGGEMPPEGGGEAPPAEGGGEAPPPAEGGEAELAASTIVNLFGKEFLIENRKDFLEVVKASKEYNKKTKDLPIFEAAADYITGKLVKVKDNKNNFIYMNNLNEFYGLDINSRKMKIYEKNDGSKKIEELKEEVIELSNIKREING